MNGLIRQSLCSAIAVIACVVLLLGTSALHQVLPTIGSGARGFPESVHDPVVIFICSPAENTKEVSFSSVVHHAEHYIKNALLHMYTHSNAFDENEASKSDGTNPRGTIYSTASTLTDRMLIVL